MTPRRPPPISLAAGVPLRRDQRSRRSDALHDDLVLVPDEVVLLLGDRGSVERGGAVGVGDRLALDPDLFVGDRNDLGDVLGRDVLAQPRPPGFTLTGAALRLLL
jgi:hypothetical protein